MNYRKAAWVVFLGLALASFMGWLEKPAPTAFGEYAHSHQPYVSQDIEDRR